MPRQSKEAMEERSDAQAEPPYLRIVAEIRRRIAVGELRAGDRVPSTRRIAGEWGVAIVTATKALATLRDEGIIQAVPRVGAVVAAPAPAPAARAPRPEPGADLTRDRIVRAAIGMADTEGLSALSMRGVAAKLDVPTMSLYRHVESKEALVLLMTDTAFLDQELPATPPAGWRAHLEMAAHLQWALYRRHPWLAQVMTLSRPLPLRNVLAYAEWTLTALEGLGLDAVTMLEVHMILYSYVRGIAVNLEAEIEAEAATGVTEAQWTDSQAPALVEMAASGRFKTFSRILTELSAGYDLDLDRIFEFGLQPMLDGLAGIVERRKG